VHFKTLLKQIPFFGEAARRWYWRLGEKTPDQPFPGSVEYWEQRYAQDGNSGVGSYGKFAEFKAEVLNAFVRDHKIRTVIEYGCGDGNQLQLTPYPSYTGFDVSETAIGKCREMFKGDASKTFRLVDQYSGEKADLTLSLDVIYHLVEDDVFESYMRRLFASADRYVIVYSSNTDDNRGYEGSHVRHRHVTKWIEAHMKDWRLLQHIPNKHPYKGDYREGSFADFFAYTR
jgi:hypothetical protein